MLSKRITKKKKNTNHLDRSKTLSNLTKLSIELIMNTKNKSMNLNEMAKILNVQKRRIYDVVNILQGIGKMRRIGVNEVQLIEDDQ